MKVTEGLAKRLVTELVGAGLVEGVPRSDGGFRLTERGQTVKWRKKKEPTRTMMVLGRQLDGRQTALVSRLLAARSWVRINELNRTNSHSGKLAESLQSIAITQFDGQDRWP